jgi:hypothetical protein
MHLLLHFLTEYKCARLNPKTTGRFLSRVSRGRHRDRSIVGNQPDWWPRRGSFNIYLLVLLSGYIFELNIKHN